MDKLSQLKLFRNVNGMNRDWYPLNMNRGFKNSIHPATVRENQAAYKGAFCFSFITEEGKAKILKGVDIDASED